MTNQEKKAYLAQYRSLDTRITRLMEEEAEWYARALSITPQSTGMPHAKGASDKVGATVAKIADLRAEINSDIDRLVDLRAEIMEKINAVGDGRLRDLLVYRYIDGLSWEGIAVKMGYCYRQVCRLHGQALSELKL